MSCHENYMGKGGIFDGSMIGTGLELGIDEMEKMKGRHEWMEGRKAGDGKELGL